MAECKWRKTCEYDSDGICRYCYSRKPQEAVTSLWLNQTEGTGTANCNGTIWINGVVTFTNSP